MTGPLTDAEVAELDRYGNITSMTPLPHRAIDLWGREVVYGRETDDSQPFVDLCAPSARTPTP